CIPEVLKHSPATKFLICGSPFTSDDKRYLERLIEKINVLNIGESVNFVDYIDRPEDFLSNLRVFVLPSISETLGRVMLEAMAMGIPVVAFNKGGPAEVINDGETGFLVKPFDTDLMAKAIVRLLNDDDLVRKIGSKARMLVKQRYTSEVMVDLLSGVFDEISGIDRRSGGRKDSEGIVRFSR
ncbi:MAG: glycosyltransferase family 4 protein, partial [bacterium]